ncbi:MAG: iron-sulfur cluster assembly scaffold protein [Candidatus Omnitrophota bacterium]
MAEYEYSEEVMEHFRNPRNVGEIKNPSGKGKVTSPVCGDVMELCIKVNSEGIITDAKFRTFGCGAAIASSSMLTELIKGKSVDEARKLTNETVIKALGGLPKPKVHCSVLAEEGLRKAIDDYESKMNEVK